MGYIGAIYVLAVCCTESTISCLYRAYKNCLECCLFNFVQKKKKKRGQRTEHTRGALIMLWWCCCCCFALTLRRCLFSLVFSVFVCLFYYFFIDLGLEWLEEGRRVCMGVERTVDFTSYSSENWIFFVYEFNGIEWNVFLDFFLFFYFSVDGVCIFKEALDMRRSNFCWPFMFSNRTRGREWFWSFVVAI